MTESTDPAASTPPTAVDGSRSRPTADASPTGEKRWGRRSGYMVNEQLQGELLLVHENNQPYPGAPTELASLFSGVGVVGCARRGEEFGKMLGAGMVAWHNV